MTRQRLTGLSLRAALRLYLVVGPQDSDDVTTVVAQAVAGGVTMVQWRDKYAEVSQQTVMAVQGLCRAAGVPFLVNDDVTLAKAIGADGVHLGQDDMDPHSARAILGDQALLGLSVGSDDEAKRYDPQVVDYVGVGPLFATSTKGDAGEALGWGEALALIERQRLNPAVLIGGISCERLDSLPPGPIPAGLAGVAVVSAIAKAEDPEKAARQLLQKMPLLSPQ